MSQLFKRYTMLAAALLSVFAMSSVLAHEQHDHHKMQDMATKQPIKLSTVSYTIPSIQLVRDDGTQIDLAQELDDGRAVVLNFVFTSCTDVCPLTSEMLSQFQTKLGKSLDKIHIMTISIDPEHDTPATLKKYAAKYNAKSQWNFYTGTLDASIEAQKAFQAYNGDKMNHVPATYLRASPGKPWQRIDGFVSPEELLNSYQELTAAK